MALRNARPTNAVVTSARKGGHSGQGRLLLDTPHNGFPGCCLRFVTPEGNLVLPEVKLWGNPEARRKVVAQALEYATALFKLNYTELETAVTKADFNGAAPPTSLYGLVDGADSPTESVFADRVTRNLREGRIVVLIVGDEIRPEVNELVAGLQAHANFHFTFALVEMPVYARPDSSDEFIVMPRTLIKTETMPATGR